MLLVFICESPKMKMFPKFWKQAQMNWSAITVIVIVIYSGFCVTCEA